MRRPALATVLLFVATLTAAAGGWTTYVNPRFGAAIDIPPGFAPAGPDAENGDGRVFASADGRSELRVWGGNLVEPDFKAAADAAISWARDDGIELSYKAVKPGWFAYSGLRKGRIVYVKSMASCKGTQSVNFQLEYPKAAKAEFDAIVKRLAASLHAEDGADCQT